MAPKCVSRSADWLTYLYVRYARSCSRKASGIHFTPVFAFLVKTNNARCWLAADSFTPVFAFLVKTNNEWCQNAFRAGEQRTLLHRSLFGLFVEKDFCQLQASEFADTCNQLP